MTSRSQGRIASGWRKPDIGGAARALRMVMSARMVGDSLIGGLRWSWCLGLWLAVGKGFELVLIDFLLVLHHQRPDLMVG